MFPRLSIFYHNVWTQHYAKIYNVTERKDIKRTLFQFGVLKLSISLILSQLLFVSVTDLDVNEVSNLNQYWLWPKHWPLQLIFGSYVTESTAYFCPLKGFRSNLPFYMLPS